MIKLLLGRLLPGGLAIGLLTSAISPLRPALQAFAVAANALGGDANAGGVDMPDADEMVAAVTPPGGGFDIKGLLGKLFGKKNAASTNARMEIEGLADKLQAKKDERAAENVAKMGKKQPSGKAKGKPKAPPKSAPPPPPENPPPGNEAAESPKTGEE